jgi:hypothetical protein
MNVGGTFSYTEGLWSPNWIVQTVDLNHDGRTDLHVYNASDGRYFEVTTLGVGAFDYRMGNGPTNSIVVFPGSR